MNTRYWYCAVRVKGVWQEYSYISDEGRIEKGAFVLVPFGRENEPRFGVVTACGLFLEEDAPYPVRSTKHIARRASKEEYDAARAPGGSRRADPVDEMLAEADGIIAYGDWEGALEWALAHGEDPDLRLRAKAVECYEHCAERKMPLAALNLGTFYYKGDVVGQDYRKAFYLYKIAADAGERRAICNCGYCFYYGRHQETDYEEAHRYFALGALLYDDANCLYKLGDLYLNGYGVPKNEAYAFLLYDRAYGIASESEEDRFCIADVRLRIGKCLLRGVGVRKDAERAHGALAAALTGFYARRKTDIFAAGLIGAAKALLAEAQQALDREAEDAPDPVLYDG